MFGPACTCLWMQRDCPCPLQKPPLCAGCWIRSFPKIILSEARHGGIGREGEGRGDSASASLTRRWGPPASDSRSSPSSGSVPNIPLSTTPSGLHGVTVINCTEREPKRKRQRSSSWKSGWVSCSSSAHLLPMVSLCLDLPPDQGLGITCGSFSIEHLPLTRPKKRFSGCLSVQGEGRRRWGCFRS